MLISRFPLVAIAAAALVLSACGKKPEQAADTGPLTVKIGHAAPLTGPQAHLGKDNENGVRLAIEELNAQKLVIGGRPVTFDMDSEDDQSDPKIATTVAQKFVDDHVNGVIGHLNSGTTIPASRLYSQAGIPQISPSATNPAYTQQGFATAFRVMANDVQQGKVLGDYAATKLGMKQIAIIDDRTAYGQGLADEFEKAAVAAGATIVKREFTTDKATDFMAILTSVKGAKPQLVFYGGMDAQAGPMARQMKTLGIAAPLMGGDGLRTPEFIKLAGDAAENTLGSTPGYPLETMPGGAAFVQKFAKYGQIQNYAPYAYDAMMVLADAMKRANSVDPAKYLPELKKTDYQGVSARIRFDEKGDLSGGAITVYKVVKGAWATQETIGGGAP